MNRRIGRKKIMENPSTPKADDLIRENARRTDDNVTGTNLN
jgi:hypothetical protein